jgi:hypothetical protein
MTDSSVLDASGLDTIPTLTDASPPPETDSAA